jgi:ribosome-binding factor A
MASPRVLKLADQIKTIVAEMLHNRVKDPRLGFVTITDVRLTGDTREATIFYTVLGEDADWAGTAVALESATGLLRSTVGKRLGLRFAPTLAFVPDEVPESARQIEELLAAARASDDEVAKRREGATFAGDPDPYKRDDEDED